jgi:LPS-assembly lipoprotein
VPLPLTRRSVLVLALLPLAACGFQLQGRQRLPASLRRLYVETDDAQSDFVAALRGVLRASGVELLAAPAADAGLLRVIRDDVTERVLTVSARNIPTDYELIYRVEVVVSAGGKELLAPEEISLSRIYSFDERRLLAKERERDLLLDGLASDMASVVLRRLGALPGDR